MRTRRRATVVRDPSRLAGSRTSELYCALCNTDWVHDDGTERSGSRRYAGGLVADLRDIGEDDLDFSCAPGGGEGTIPDRVAGAMRSLGWHGTGHGGPSLLIDFRTGERKILVDGEWLDNGPDADLSR